MLPVTDTSAMRHAVYRMFMYNTPFSVFDITRRFACRLLFIRNGTVNTLRVDNLCLMPYSGGPPLYPDLLYCWSLPRGCSTSERKTPSGNDWHHPPFQRRRSPLWDAQFSDAVVVVCFELSHCTHGVVPVLSRDGKGVSDFDGWGYYTLHSRSRVCTFQHDVAWSSPQDCV